MFPVLTNAVSVVKDLIFHPICLGCGGLCDEHADFRHVCARCSPWMVQVQEPHCDGCEHPFWGVVVGERICPHCEGMRPLYGRAKTTVLFKGPARELVLALKYRGGTFALEDMKVLIQKNQALGDFVRAAILVPVPLHPRKLRSRGYTQSVLLAELLERVPQAQELGEEEVA